MKAQLSQVLEPLNARWQQLGQREQQALRLLSIVLGVLAIWLVLIQPVFQWRQQASQQLANAQSTYQQLLQKARRSINIKRSRPPRSGSSHRCDATLGSFLKSWHD